MTKGTLVLFDRVCVCVGGGACMCVHTHTRPVLMVYVVFQVGVVHISDGSKLYLLPTSPITQELGEPRHGTTFHQTERPDRRLC